MKVLSASMSPPQDVKAMQQYMNIEVTLPPTVLHHCINSSRFEHDDTARFDMAGSAFDAGRFNSRNDFRRQLRSRIDEPPPVCVVEGGKLRFAPVCVHVEDDMQHGLVRRLSRERERNETSIRVAPR